LPVSVPPTEVDSPVLSALPVAGELSSAEGLLVGYRGYDRTGSEPHFSFGHGLGYTDWTYESFAAPEGSIMAGQDLPLTVTVRNSREGAGTEVAQVYLHALDDEPSRPPEVLAALARVTGAPRERVGGRL